MDFSTEKLNLLVMIPTEAHGGCEYNALTFAADMAQNYDCSVTASFPLNDKLAYMASLASANGVNFVRLDCDFEGSDSKERVAEQEKAAWDVIDRVQPDAVFIPLPWPKRGQGLISACHALGIPTLVKFALVPEEWSSNEFVHPPLREALVGNQTWFANSRYSAELLEKHFKLPDRTVDSFHVGPIGLHRLTGAFMANEIQPDNTPLAERLGAPSLASAQTVVTTVARLSVQKGYEVLLEAAAKVIAQDPSVHFVWVGEGELRRELETGIMQRHLGYNVHLAGFRSDVREILRQSDVFAFPTIYEGGCSQALLEAMEERLPIVASDASAIGEIITHRENGLMAEAGNAEDFATHLLEVIADRELSGSMADAAAKTVKAFSADVMFANTRERLERLMRRRFQPAAPDVALRAMPQARFELEGPDAVMDFAQSHFVYGAKVKGVEAGQRPTLWLEKDATFIVADPDVTNFDAIFFHCQAVSDEAIEHLSLTINDVPVKVRLARDTVPGMWKAKAIVPEETRDTFRAPLRIDITCGDDAIAREALPGSTANERVALVVRKLVFNVAEAADVSLTNVADESTVAA
ncbi:MAG: glycosyltransferase [Pseudomonadota bacterium]